MRRLNTDVVRYQGQLKNYKFNIIKRRKGRKKKTVKQCLDILTFDVEVTSGWIKDDKIIGYDPGHDADYWNEMEKVSLPYIWQFSINEDVYYGRELFEFEDLLSDLPKGVSFIIWVHNLGYEHATVLMNLFHTERLFARSPHDPMYVVYKEHPDIMFRCSYILTNMSLETWGNELGLPKLVGNLDYNILRTPKTPLFDFEMDYCERDCQVVYAGIKDHLNYYTDIYDIPLTNTGKVRRPIKKKLTNNKEYMKEIKRLIPRDAEEYKRFQKVFAGGYTHGNRKYLDKIIRDNIYHSDEASAYPFCIIAYKYPYSKWAYIGKRLPDPRYFENRAYIMNLYFEDLECTSWNTYISVSKTAHTGVLTDNGRILCAKTCQLWVTEQDYITIMNNYKWSKIESLGTWIAHKQYLPTPYIEEVLKLYAEKTTLKGRDPVLYAQKKAHLNSLYGMSVSSLIYSDVEQLADGSWHINDLTREQVEAELTRMKRWFDKKFFLSYACGCYITAYARRRIWKCIEYDNHAMDKDLLYTDTDSLFYIGNHDLSWFNDECDELLKAACEYHGLDYNLTRPLDKQGMSHPLGVMEYEDIGEIKAFRTLGAKKYIEEHTDNKLYMTVSGVNKSAALSLKSINQFEDGHVFDKDDPNVHRQEITYLYDMPEVTYPDGYVSKLKYGINMRPTGYKLSVPKIYDNLTALVNRSLSDDKIQRKRGQFK